MWDPVEYLRFADHRGRPFVDLLARVGAEDPSTVVDLGCGPGNLTVTLAERWPAARVTGLDSSAQMIERATADHGRGLDQGPAGPRPDRSPAAGGPAAGRVDFAVVDLRDWAPREPVDVLVSNATLQWVPGHLDLLARLVAAVRPGGWFAFQVPGNFAEPSHAELAAVLDLPRWRHRLADVELATPWAAEPADYHAALVAQGAAVDVWETTYLQVLEGPDAVLRWVSGTALRPVLTVLDDAERAELTADYGARLRRAYPQRGFGTVLPFRRIFAVAQRGAPA
jgi:trans-aconitate 2-methyltransferase